MHAVDGLAFGVGTGGGRAGVVVRKEGGREGGVSDVKNCNHGE